MTAKEKTTEALPAQVRQMGAVDGNLRIYVEDYVYSYLRELARGEREALAALFGRRMGLDGESALLICGAVAAKGDLAPQGRLSEESLTYIKEQKKLFFAEMEAVGWYRSQPGFGTFVPAGDLALYEASFPQGEGVLFYCDPSDKQEAFYYKPDPAGAPVRAAGFFVYYEKNNEMQEFMVESRTPPQPAPEPPEDTAVLGRRRLRVQKNRYRKTTAMDGLVTGLCAVFCLVCVTALFHSYESRSRLENLETEVAVVRDIASEALEVQQQIVQEPVEVPVTVPVLAPQEKEAEPVWYTVQEGDTLIGISETFYDTADMVGEIMALNGIDDADRIYFGRTIQLPDL